MGKKICSYLRAYGVKIILYMIILPCMTLINGCDCNLNDLVDRIFGKADDLTEKVIASLDNAIGSLNATSANYQEILQKLINELPSKVQSTVTNEVSNLLNRTVAAAGAEFRCNADFLRIRVQQALQRIKAKFLKQPVPPIEPQLCTIVPLAIDMNLPPARRNKIEFYGYDFDVTTIQVLRVDGTRRVDVSDKLTQPTHYHMILNLGSNGVPINSNTSKIILRWNNRDISSISVIQPSPDICQTEYYTFQPASISFMPPHTEGDKEFAGHGPTVNCNVKLLVYGNRVIARVYMKARETKADWTTAEGTKEFTIYTADPNKTIEAIVSPTDASYSYTDNDCNVDEFPGSGPVRKFRFMGDGKGNDVGYHTRVDIDFNNIRLQLKQTGDCVSSATIRMLELQDALSPTLKQRIRTMHHIKFQAPKELPGCCD